MEKGKANVDLPDQVILFLFLFLFFFFSFSFFYFFHVKYGRTPLYLAALQGEEQIVQILLEKGEPNVDLADLVILLIVSSFFFFSFSFFYFFNVKYGITPLYMAAQNGDEQIVQILLEKGEPNVDFASEVILLIVFFFFFFFLLSHFSILLNVKYGTTPLYAAAENGYEQIVEILLEKGKPNVDFPLEVILLIVSFSFLFFFLFTFSFFYFFECKGWKNSSFCCCF